MIGNNYVIGEVMKYFLKIFGSLNEVVDMIDLNAAGGRLEP